MIPVENVLVVLSNKQVSTLTDITIQYTVQTIATAGSKIKITFPPEIKLKNNGQIYLSDVSLQGRNAGPVDCEITSSPGTDLNDIVTITDAI